MFQSIHISGSNGSNGLNSSNGLDGLNSLNGSSSGPFISEGRWDEFCAREKKLFIFEVKNVGEEIGSFNGAINVGCNVTDRPDSTKIN